MYARCLRRSIVVERNDSWPRLSETRALTKHRGLRLGETRPRTDRIRQEFAKPSRVGSDNLSMNSIWPSLVTLALCIACVSLQMFWGGQDRQGGFHAENLWANGNLGITLFFLGPYVLFATAAVVAWKHRAAFGNLAFATVLCGIAILGAWLDHREFLRSTPGRESQQMLNFLATILVWIGGAAALLTIGSMRIASRK